MTIALVSAQIRHERRARLFFSNTVAAISFTSTSYYLVDCTNNAGPSPLVSAVFAVASTPNAVELQLSSDLAPGGVYKFSADGVVADDHSTVPGGSEAYAAFGEQVTRPNKGPVTELEALLYGLDIRFEGGEFIENAAGDLETISGPPLVRRDLWNRLLSDGLPWDPDYGVKSREWIDGSPGALFALRGRTSDQMTEDDRVRDVEVTIKDDGAEATVTVAPILIGDSNVASIEPIDQTFVLT